MIHETKETKKFYWENDTWGVIHTEQGETLEMNLHTCDVSGRQYITFYPEQTEDVKKSKDMGCEGLKSMKVLASYEVNQKY